MAARAIVLIIVSMSFAAAAQRRNGTIVLPVVDDHDIGVGRLSTHSQELNQWIRGIAQDNEGFMWFATTDGLFRYDGYTLRSYFHDPSNPNSISSNNLLTLYTDRSGMLWIGSFFNGLDRLDPARGISHIIGMIPAQVRA